MTLQLADTICLSAPQGPCEIQLLFGDITCLPLEEKVDVVITSAFPGDYLPIPSTLIGALQKKLAINVGVLARRKAVDLRRHFACWVSEPLPAEKPFGKLVCFETLNFDSSLVEQVSLVFRAFMPIFNNQDTTVISPVLASGNQNVDKTLMLTAMVNSAAGWIMAGLPMRCLKIVLYKGEGARMYPEDVRLKDLFGELKEIWEKKNKQVTVDIKVDIYVIYNAQDESWMGRFKDRMGKVNSEYVIAKPVKFDHDKVWQEDVYNVMVVSKRIVALLTPNFLEDKECLEQFNMAMCCNRRQRKEILYPFYIQTVEALPSYMSLVQYVECRVRKEGESEEEKIQTACVVLVKNIEVVSTPAEDQEQKALPEADTEFDVFISYSHRFPKPAEHLRKILTDKDQNLKVFFDREELTTGSLWQQRLYQAADHCRCMVVLLTPPYLTSTVCQEEFSIGLARYFSERDKFAFLPVCTESIQTMKRRFCAVPVLDGRKNTEEVLEKISTAVIQWLKSGQDPEKIICKPKKVPSLDQILAINRKKTFGKETPSWNQEPNERTVRVVISFSHSCLKFASLLHSLLRPKLSEGYILFLSEHQMERMYLLDRADMIILLISDEFPRSPQLMEELHVALCRQRASPGKDLVYLIQTRQLDSKPTYLHLLPYQLCLSDPFWPEAAGPFSSTKMVKFTCSRNEFVGTYQCSEAEHMALTKAAQDITKNLAQGTSNFGDTNIVNISLKSLENKDKEDDDVPAEEFLMKSGSTKKQREMEEVIVEDGKGEEPVTDASAGVAAAPVAAATATAATAHKSPNSSTDAGSGAAVNVGNDTNSTGNQGSGTVPVERPCGRIDYEESDEEELICDLVEDAHRRSQESKAAREQKNPRTCQLI